MIEALGTAALRLLDPETAHGIALKALRYGAVSLPGAVTSARLKTELSGLKLPNPVGLAAGFDKNAEAVGQLTRAGFGFVEIGAATPRPQPGNPKPRLFRLSSDKAAINRFGFNNDGADAIAARLSDVARQVPVGLNLGANKDSADRAADFAKVLRITGPFVDFATVNVSSPNTEKLRDLQGRAALAALLSGVMQARAELARPIPVFLKIAPDLSSDEIHEITQTAIEAGLSGIIATNTTLSREGLTSSHKEETGGLSGAPLFERSTRVLAQVSKAADGRIPIIGVGGVSSAQQALAKIRAGATAVQLYTAMVFQGLSLAGNIARDMDKTLQTDGIANIADIVGTDRDKWL